MESPCISAVLYTVKLEQYTSVLETEFENVASSAPKFPLVIALPASFSANVSPSVQPSAFTSAKAVDARAFVVYKDKFVIFNSESV